MGRRGIVMAITLALTAGASVPVAAQERPAGASAATMITLDWQRVDVPGGGLGLRVEDILATRTGFIAVGGGSKVSPIMIARVWTSRTGRTWRSVPLTGRARSGIIRAIVRTPDGYVAVGQGPCVEPCAAVWRSPDGIAWRRLSHRPAFADGVMRDVVRHGDRLIAVGCRNFSFHCLDGRVWASDDGGRTWDRLGDVPWLNFNAVTVADGLLVGAGDTFGFDEVGQATYGTSGDGEDWKVNVPDEDDDLGRMLAAARRGDTALVGGGGVELSEFGSSLTRAVLFARPPGGEFEPIKAPVFRRARIGAIAARGDLVLLVGARQGPANLLPYSLWTSDLATFTRVRFPEASEQLASFVYAAAFSRNGKRAVVGGDSGSRAAIWFSQVVTP